MTIIKEVFAYWVRSTRMSLLPWKGCRIRAKTVVARGFAHFPGGKGANQAVAAARMGAGTLMIGATGADEAGSMMRAFLQDDGVDTEMVGVNPRQPTGQAFINVSANRRERDRHRSGRKCRIITSRYPV